MIRNKFKVWDGFLHRWLDPDEVWITASGKLVIRPTGETSEFEQPPLFISLVRYIGLHDKDSREAYHKDILRDCKTRSLWVVEWDDEWARFTLVSVGIPFHERDKHRLMVFLKRMEYAGNTYENPELLERKD